MIKEKRINIIGVGNLLMSDEGFGCHIIDYLENHFLFPHNVRLIDGGTAGIYIAPLLESCNYALILDVIKAKDKKPGHWEFIDLLNFPSRNLQTSLSPHQWGILEIISICQLRDKLPEKIEMLGVVPHIIQTGLKLSPVLETLLPKVAQTVVSRLVQEGVEIKSA